MFTLGEFSLHFFGYNLYKVFGMKVWKFKKIFLIMSFTSVASIVSASFLMPYNNSLVSKSNSKTIDKNHSTTISSSTDLATNYSNESLKFSDNSYSETNTSIGYLQVSGNYIYLVSWFGNQLWKYDVSNSNFIKNGSSSVVVKNINVIYIPKYDRVLVYGIKDSNTSFVFQLNNSDGSEYYVNPNSSSKYSDSCLISSSSNQVISSVNLINLLSSTTAIMIPREMNNNHKVTCTTFSLLNYSITPITYDATGGWDATNSSGLSQNSLDEIVGITSYSNITYISMKGSTIAGDNQVSKTAKIIVIKLINNIYNSCKIWTLYESNSNNVDLTKASFRFITTFKNDVPRSYVAMIKNDDDNSSLSPSINSTYSQLVYIDPTLSGNDDIKL